jgi:hypothetical protein
MRERERASVLKAACVSLLFMISPIRTLHWKEVTGTGEKLPNISRVTKSRRVRWAGYVVYMVEMKNA